jgi:regulator of protease activity HflC (stomatin/prohibitin superfamily)
MLFLVVTIPSVAIVPSGYRGVVLRWNSATKRVLPEGLVIVQPISERVALMNVREQKRPAEGVKAQSSDGQEETLTATINYRLTPETVYQVWTNTGKDWENVLLPGLINEALRVATTGYTARESSGKRVEIAVLAQKTLQGRLDAKKAGVTILGVTIDNIDFSKEFNDSLNTTSDLNNKLAQAQKQKEIDKVNAERLAITEQGKADAAIISAEGTAEANKIISASVSPMTIQLRTAELFFEKWDGKMPSVYGGNVTSLFPLPGAAGAGN